MKGCEPSRLRVSPSAKRPFLSGLNKCEVQSAKKVDENSVKIAGNLKVLIGMQIEAYNKSVAKKKRHQMVLEK